MCLVGFSCYPFYMDAPLLLTARQVADELDLSVQTIYDLAHRGDLPCTRVTASSRPRLRFLASDVAAFLDRANGIHRAELRPVGAERR